MSRHWAKWMPKPSHTGEWLIAVFTTDKPCGVMEVGLRLSDGTVVTAIIDGSRSTHVRNGVWACPTSEHMTIKTVPACKGCGTPMRLPMASGGARHHCQQLTTVRRATEPGFDTLF